MSIRNELLEEILVASSDIQSRLTDIEANYVYSGRGGIGVNAPVLIGSVALTPVDITGFDTELLTPKGVVQTPLSNNSLSLGFAGVWSLSVKISLSFDEFNAGRVISLRFFNKTTMTPATQQYNYFVGRNQGGININLNSPFEIDSGSINNQLSMQIFSDSDTFLNVTNIGTIYALTNSSEKA